MCSNWGPQPSPQQPSVAALYQRSSPRFDPTCTSYSFSVPTRTNSVKGQWAVIRTLSNSIYLAQALTQTPQQLRHKNQAKCQTCSQSRAIVECVHTGTCRPGREGEGKRSASSRGLVWEPRVRTQGAAGYRAERGGQKRAGLRAQDPERQIWAGAGTPLPKAGLGWTPARRGGLPTWPSRLWGRNLSRAWWEAESKVERQGPGGQQVQGRD